MKETTPFSDDSNRSFYPRRFIEADQRHLSNRGLRRLYRPAVSGKESTRQAEEYKVAYLRQTARTILNNVELYREILREEQALAKSSYLYPKVLGEIIAAYLTYGETAVGNFDFEHGIFEPTAHVVLAASMASASPENRQQILTLINQISTMDPMNEDQGLFLRSLEGMNQDIQILQSDPTGITLMRQQVQATKQKQHPGLMQPWVSRGAQAAGEIYVALQQAVPNIVPQ